MLMFSIFLLVFILIMAVAFQTSGDMWRRTFCNDDGTPSIARIILVFLVLVLVSWADMSVRASKGIPEIPGTWENFLYVLVGYAFGKKILDTGSKVVETMKAVKGGANAATEDQPAGS